MTSCCIVYVCIVIAAGYNNHESINLIIVEKCAAIKLTSANTHSAITDAL
jgi:hypothetical protein